MKPGSVNEPGGAMMEPKQAESRRKGHAGPLLLGAAIIIKAPRVCQIHLQRINSEHGPAGSWMRSGCRTRHQSRVRAGGCCVNRRVQLAGNECD